MPLSTSHAAGDTILATDINAIATAVNTLVTTVAGLSNYTDEQVRDVIAAALVAGSNVTITPNDGADTITVDASGGGWTKQYAEIQTSESTSSTTFTDLTTSGPAVTITVPASGILDVDLGCRMNGYGYMGFALSGANTRAVNGTTDVLLLNGSGLQNASRTVVLTGLAPGSTTVTAKYAVGSGTVAFAMRTISATAR